MGQNAGRLDVLARTPAPTPAVARAGTLSLDDMWRQAQILARSGLVPFALKGNTEGVMLVGMRGAELGWSFTTALDFIDVFEGRAVINAQGGLAVIRKAGHRARFVHEECNDKQAVIVGQRRERDGTWGPEERITWTIEEAQTAGLLDEWVERKVKKPGDQYDTKEKFVLRRQGDGYVPKKFGATTMPDWVTKKIADGEVKHKDNWWNYPSDQLKARAAARLRRNVFSDVMAAYGVDDYTAEEMGAPATTDLDETAEADPDILDAEIVEQGEDPGVTPAQMSEGVERAGETRPAPQSETPSGSTDSDDEELAAFIRWKLAGKPRDEIGVPVNVPAEATIEPERGRENEDAQVVGGSAAPAPSGPAPTDLKARAKAAGVTQADLLRKAIEFSAARDLPAPAALSELDEQVEADLSDWLGE